MALAPGAAGTRHISVVYRFFARTRWSLNLLGQVVCTLALWVSLPMGGSDGFALPILFRIGHQPLAQRL